VVTLKHLCLNCFLCRENEATLRHEVQRWPLATILAWAVVLMRVSPVTFRGSPATAKHETSVLGACKVRPLLSRLAWPVQKRCGTTGGPVSLPPDPAERRC